MSKVELPDGFVEDENWYTCINLNGKWRKFGTYSQWDSVELFGQDTGGYITVGLRWWLENRVPLPVTFGELKIGDEFWSLGSRYKKTAGDVALQLTAYTKFQPNDRVEKC